MATPNFEQIQSFSVVTQQLTQRAVDEFMAAYSVNMSVDDIADLASMIAEQYNMLGAELGAQWYDLCSRLANLEVDEAELAELDPDAIRNRARAAADKYANGATLDNSVNYFLQNIIQDSIRTTGDSNLWRDYERGMVSGRWARVPVGDTCAWCLMLASQGAWYVSKKSALGAEAGHYHDGCNCIAVYHADPYDIPNYQGLQRYKAMYYEAENARIANARGREPYSEELQRRVNLARAEHRAKYDAGETDKKWTKYNETLIVMRYQNAGLK